MIGCTIKRINRLRLYKNVIWIITGLILAVIVGAAIADAKWIYFGVILSPFIIYICIEKPFIFPFGLYVFLLPFGSILSVTGDAQGASLTKIFGALTILALSLKGAFENKLKKPDIASIWWVLILFYGLLSIWWAIKPEAVLSVQKTLFSLLLFYLLVASYKIQRTEFETLKWCILLGGVLASVYLIYNRSLDDQSRVSLMYGESATDPNVFAFSLIIPASISIEMMMKHKGVMMKALFGVSIGVLLYSIILSGSRGGMLGIGMVIIVYILLIKQRITFVTMTIIIGIILISFIPEFFFDRWGSAIERGGAGRLDIWYAGYKALGKYWLFGAGLNNFHGAYNEFANYSPSFQGWNRAPHSIYLGFFVQLGVVGITLMVLAIRAHYKIIQSRFSKHNIDSVALMAAFCAVLVSSFFLDTFEQKSFWLLWMMIMMQRNVLDGEGSSVKTNCFKNTHRS